MIYYSFNEIFWEEINMTDNRYLYQYFLEKSTDDQKNKKTSPSKIAEVKNVKEKTKEDKRYE